jgi:hypothetical protein
MPEFKRTYTQGFVDKVLPANLQKAKDIEGHRKVQEYLEGIGADQDEDGRYLIGGLPTKEQIGVLFDWFLWSNYQKYKISLDVDAARIASYVVTDDDFEHGGAA